MNSDSMSFKLTAALLALALLLGGAGVGFPLLQMSVGAAAALVAAIFVLTPGRTEHGSLDKAALVLLLLIMLLPLFQLIPLPPAIWHLLPGREVPKQLDAILGWKLWRPWTLDVEATIRSWLVLIPASVVFVGCLRMKVQRRVQLLWLVVGFALLNAILGIVQLATGGSATPYPSAHSGYPIGFFVNRNHSAALMLAAMPIAAGLGIAPSRSGQSRTSALTLAVAMIGILAIVVIGTTSRTGLLLLPVSVSISLFILFRPSAQPRRAWRVLLAVTAIGLVLLTSRRFDLVLRRFTSAEEPRFAYWTDIEWALRHYGLAGTGFGTFVPVFQSAESLEGLAPQIVNHAHNDYLEVLLGGGIAGVLLFGAFGVLIAVAAYRSVRPARQPHLATVRFSVATAVALLLAYSLVDYPLRMPAIAAFFALCCAILLPSSAPNARGGAHKDLDRGRSGSLGWLSVKGVAALGFLAIVLVVMVQAALSARALANQRYADAANLAPWSTLANNTYATVELSQFHRSEAWRLASAAIRLSPISAPAIRNLALVKLVEGKSDGHRLMQIGEALGWRDPVTQLWAIEAAVRSGEPEKAVQRAEGLFRQRISVLPALQLLLRAPNLDVISRLLAARLEQRPDWRNEVLLNAGNLSATDLIAFRHVLSRLNNSSAPPTTKEMKLTLDILTSGGRVLEAQQLWTQFHPALIDNGDFKFFQAAELGLAPPTGWDIPPRSRQAVVAAIYDVKSGERGLRIDATDWVTIMSQRTLLPAGSYTLSYQARESGPSPVVLRWQLSCRGANKPQVALAQLIVPKGWSRYSAPFAVPPRDCAVQTLALKRTEANSHAETWLDNIRFDPNSR